MSCSIDRNFPLISSEEEKILSEFKKLDDENIAIIANEKEKGKRMVLCLTYKEKNTSEIIKNQRVLFYQATNNGEYEQTDPNDESTARLNTTAITDHLGRIFVTTILPGDYGSTDDNRHIHTTVFGFKPEAYDLHFSQYANSGLKSFIKNSNQHFLADLKYSSDSTLVAFMTITPKR